MIKKHVPEEKTSGVSDPEPGSDQDPSVQPLINAARRLPPLTPSQRLLQKLKDAQEKGQKKKPES